MNLTPVIDQYLLILTVQVTSTTKDIFGEKFLFPAGPSNHVVHNSWQAGHCETINLMTQSLERFLAIMEKKKKKTAAACLLCHSTNIYPIYFCEWKELNKTERN